MERKKSKTVKMNMRSAVLYVTSQVNDGKTGFFLTTEFGKIGVEVNSSPQVDPLHPVIVIPWQQSPETVWALTNKDADADYYVSINIFQTEVADHMAIIEALSRVMLKDGGFDDPEDNIIQAMILCYMQNYDEVNVTVNSMVSDYTSTHMGPALGLLSKSKMFAPVQIVVREMFQQKIAAGDDVIQMGTELLRMYKNSGKIDANYFFDNYCEEVFGIFLYARMKQERNLESTLQNIINFKGINNPAQNQIAVNK